MRSNQKIWILISCILLNVCMVSADSHAEEKPMLIREENHNMKFQITGEEMTFFTYRTEDADCYLKKGEHGELIWYLARQIDKDADFWTCRESEVVWNGEFYFQLMGDNVLQIFAEKYQEQALSFLTQAELDEISALQNEYYQWETAYETWLFSLEDRETMTPAQMEFSRKSAGVLSDYEITDKANALAKEICASHPDILKSFQLGLSERGNEKNTTFVKSNPIPESE